MAVCQLRTHATQQINVRVLLSYIAPSLAEPPCSSSGQQNARSAFFQVASTIQTIGGYQRCSQA